ncbi:Cytochrome P450 [Trinorchestia longiramus]|nr:Cytochrome P450 [Trinorchestia longiramus]
MLQWSWGELVVSCASIVVLTIIMLLQWTRGDRNKKPSPPGPWAWPVIGSLLLLDPRKPHESLRALVRQYGPVVQLQLGNVRAVVLAREDIIRSTFAKEAASGRAPLYLTHGIMQGMGE